MPETRLNISPQPDARDPLFTCIDVNSLPDAQVPDVLGEGVGGEPHAETVVGDDVARARCRVVRRHGGLHVVNDTEVNVGVGR